MLNRISLILSPCGKPLLLTKMLVLAFQSLNFRVVLERKNLIILYKSLSKDGIEY